jgi:hypothetical protein
VGICLEIASQSFDDPYRPIDDLERSNESVSVDKLAAEAAHPLSNTCTLPFNARGICRCRHDHFLSHRPLSPEPFRVGTRAVPLRKDISNGKTSKHPSAYRSLTIRAYPGRATGARGEPSNTLKTPRKGGFLRTPRSNFSNRWSGITSNRAWVLFAVIRSKMSTMFAVSELFVAGKSGGKRHGVLLLLP